MPLVGRLRLISQWSIRQVPAVSGIGRSPLIVRGEHTRGTQ